VGASAASWEPPPEPCAACAVYRPGDNGYAGRVAGARSGRPKAPGAALPAPAEFRRVLCLELIPRAIAGAEHQATKADFAAFDKARRDARLANGWGRYP
jgi:hypothetical protein